MKSFTCIIILASLILPSQTAFSHPSFSKVSIGQLDSPIPIIKSSFYVGIRNSKDEEFVWTESNLVPSIPDNSCYSWEIELDTELISIPIKEILFLPEKPKSWGDRDDMTLLHDNRISVTKKVLEVDRGVITNMWCVAEGDPAGNYKIEVYIKGVLAESFSFVVGLKL